MRAADYGWLALIAYILTYEIFAPRDELLSQGWDRYLTRFPILSRLVPFLIAFHLVNWMPRWCDPLALVSNENVWSRLL